MGIVLVGLAVSAPSAGATFPGANGVLAVQPSSGGGVLLVDPRSGTSLPLCPLRWWFASEW